MSKSIHKEAGRLTADALAMAAAQGVERALAARAAMTELTPEQAEQVSGAALAAPTAALRPTKLCPPIIYGLWYPVDPKQLDSLSTPQL